MSREILSLLRLPVSPYSRVAPGPRRKHFRWGFRSGSPPKVFSVGVSFGVPAESIFGGVPFGVPAESTFGGVILRCSRRKIFDFGTGIKVKAVSSKIPPFWRHHPDLNRRMKVLQTFALPLGYGAAVSAARVPYQYIKRRAIWQPILRIWLARLQFLRVRSFSANAARPSPKGSSAALLSAAAVHSSRSRTARSLPITATREFSSPSSKRSSAT